MSFCIRILLIVGAITVLVFMLRKIRQSKLKIEYILFWITFSVILVFMGLFPQVISWISELLGFQAPINLAYLVIILSALENKVDNLTQQLAIDKKLEEEK